MLHRLLMLLFPPRCVLCRTFLCPTETDLCHDCREKAPTIQNSNIRISFLAGWTAVWYYKDTVRDSLLRFKFAGRRCYAPAYGRILAMKLQNAAQPPFDVLTFVPIAPRRRFHRGYDQVELLANAVGRELGLPAVRTLRKIRNAPPQSGIGGMARRKANVLGAYRTVDPAAVRGKRILLLDDVITTGATASECARVLLTAGASEVYCACIAAAAHNNIHNIQM